MTNLSQIAAFPTVKKTYNRSAHYFEVTNAKMYVSSCAFELDEALEIFDRLPAGNLWISSYKRGYVSKRKLLQSK